MSSLRAVVVVAVVLLVVYGFYTYNELQTELQKRDSREERIKRQLDTVSSELESLYEQKTNLEKAMKAEQDENKKSKDALEKHAQSVEVQCTKEKEELSNRVSAITTENKRLEGRIDDLEREINKLQQKEQKLEEDKNHVAEQYKEEYMQLKTDRDATITQLKAKITELQQRNALIEDELKARVNDIHTVQHLLNASRQEYSKLENQLKAVQHDFEQQRQRNQELIASQEAALRKANIDGNVAVDNQKQLRHDALQHDTAAAAAAVVDQVVAKAGATHTASAPAHEANVANDRQQVHIPAHREDRANISPAPGRQHLAIDNGVGKLDNGGDHRQEQVIDRPHGAAML